MKVNYEITTQYRRQEMMRVFEDPELTLKTFLPLKEMEKLEDRFYKVTIRRSLGKLSFTVRYINNGEKITLIVNFIRPKAVGRMEISFEDNKILVEGSASITTDPVILFQMNRRMDRLKSEINELIRMERIKRKLD